MDEQRFQDLRNELTHKGIAGRHARRAVRELEQRFQQLVAEAQARGESLDGARLEAHRLLGTDQSIIDGIAKQPGLRAWSCRWPGLIFTVTPLSFYIVLVVVTLMGISAWGDWAGRHLSAIHPTTDTANRLSLLGRGLVLWCMPVFLAASFAYLAYRHRVALRWPVAAIVLLSALSALGDFSFIANGSQLTVSAGLGTSLHMLPTQVLRGVILALLVIVPLLVATRSRIRTDQIARS